jgi:voltage-gated potassium channel
VETTHFRLKLFVILFISVMVLGTLIFAQLEHIPVFDAFYFSVVTVATVGYGDIHPTTGWGKVLAIALIITGVGTFLEVIAGITQVMLRRRDKELRQEKLNMIIGLFFSEIGTRLLRLLADSDPDIDALIVEDSAWAKQGAKRESRQGRHSGHSFAIDITRAKLSEMRGLLDEKGDLLLRLLENPTLLEHESFTELLRAIFHLRDELLNRQDLESLPPADKRHLEGDMERIYKLIAAHWSSYMDYLSANYPYLFSLAKRTNPFDRSASAIVFE